MTTTDPTSTALAVPDTPPAPSIPSTWEASWRLAQRISSTPFVPGALRGRPEAVLACVLYGAELGLGPMQSLQGIHVIDGRVAAAPELMRALIARHGHRLDIVDATDQHVTLSGRRADTGATATITWTIDDAQRAGLLDKKGGSWRAYPRAMLLARATSELARMLFADVIAGLSYTPEEVASIDAGPDWTTEPKGVATSDTLAAPPGKPDPAALFERVKATAGTELADRLRSLAERAGRRLTAADFHAHPVWASVVQDVLDDDERRQHDGYRLGPLEMTPEREAAIDRLRRAAPTPDYELADQDPLSTAEGTDIVDAELVEADDLNTAEGIQPMDTPAPGDDQ
jgi:hypothetical protein